MEGQSVIIAMEDTRLASVLAVWLNEALARPVVVWEGLEGINRGDVVVLTPADCDALTAAELDARGVRVIVLAPLDRADDADRYRRAGASYFAMSMHNNDRLVATIKDALLPYSEPAIDFRAASNHVLSPKCSA